MSCQQDESGFDDGRFERYLAALPVPPMPADLPACCRMRVAANAASYSDKAGGKSSRQHRRLILLGTTVVIAAAAAVVASLLRAPELFPASASLRQIAAAATQPYHESAPSHESAAAASPTDKVAPDRKVSAALETPRPFTVRVLPLQNESQSAVSHAAIEEFYAVFLSTLRRIPGLTLITAESTGISQDTPAAFQLSVKGYGSISSSKWNVDVIARAMSSGANQQALAIVPFSVQGGGGGLCTGAETADLATPCSDPASMAAAQVDAMRKLMFPADPALKRQLESRLLDRMLDPVERMRALTGLRFARLEIAGGQGSAATTARMQAPPMDDATIRGAADLGSTAADPEVRASVWRSLRGAHEPALIEPLLESLQQDGNDEVRIEAITTLAKDYSGESQVRAALLSASRDDSRQLVRMIAQRTVTDGVAGEAMWRDYVVTTLKDATLPGMQRLEPFSYTVLNDSPKQVAAILDDEGLQTLVAVFPSAWSGSPKSETLARAVVAALQWSSSPFVVDFYAEALRQARNPMTRAASVKALAAGWRADPRAREALQAVAVSEPDPELRKIATDALQSRGPAASPAAPQQ
jgi:hypothetical protein